MFSYHSRQLRLLYSILRVSCGNKRMLSDLPGGQHLFFEQRRISPKPQWVDRFATRPEYLLSET